MSARLAAAETQLDAFRGAGAWSEAAAALKALERGYSDSTIVSSAHPTPAAAAAYRHTVAGEIAVHKRKWDDARKCFTRALAACPTYVDALILLAQLAVETGAWPPRSHATLAGSSPALSGTHGAGMVGRMRGVLPRVPHLNMTLPFRKRGAAGGAVGATAADAVNVASEAPAPAPSVTTPAVLFYERPDVDCIDLLTRARAGAVSNLAGLSEYRCLLRLRGLYLLCTLHERGFPPTTFDLPLEQQATLASAVRRGERMGFAHAHGAVAVMPAHRLSLNALCLLGAIACCDTAWQLLSEHVRQKYGLAAPTPPPPALDAAGCALVSLPSAPLPARGLPAGAPSLLIAPTLIHDVVDSGSGGGGGSGGGRGGSTRAVRDVTASPLSGGAAVQPVFAAGDTLAVARIATGVAARAPLLLSVASPFLMSDEVTSVTRLPPRAASLTLSTRTQPAPSMRSAASGGSAGVSGRGASFDATLDAATAFPWQLAPPQGAAATADAASAASSSSGALTASGGASGSALLTRYLSRVDARFRDLAVSCLSRAPLLLHRLGDLPAAITAYRACLEWDGPLAQFISGGTKDVLVEGLLMALSEGARTGALLLTLPQEALLPGAPRFRMPPIQVAHPHPHPPQAPLAVDGGGSVPRHVYAACAVPPWAWCLAAPASFQLPSNLFAPTPGAARTEQYTLASALRRSGMGDAVGDLVHLISVSWQLAHPRYRALIAAALVHAPPTHAAYAPPANGEDASSVSTASPSAAGTRTSPLLTAYAAPSSGGAPQPAHVALPSPSPSPPLSPQAAAAATAASMEDVLLQLADLFHTSAATASACTLVVTARPRQRSAWCALAFALGLQSLLTHPCIAQAAGFTSCADLPASYAKLAAAGVWSAPRALLPPTAALMRATSAALPNRVEHAVLSAFFAAVNETLSVSKEGRAAATTGASRRVASPRSEEVEGAVRGASPAPPPPAPAAAVQKGGAEASGAPAALPPPPPPAPPRALDISSPGLLTSPAQHSTPKSQASSMASAAAMAEGGVDEAGVEVTLLPTAAAAALSPALSLLTPTLQDASARSEALSGGGTDTEGEGNASLPTRGGAAALLPPSANVATGASSRALASSSSVGAPTTAGASVASGGLDEVDASLPMLEPVLAPNAAALGIHIPDSVLLLQAAKVALMCANNPGAALSFATRAVAACGSDAPFASAALDAALQRALPPRTAQQLHVATPHEAQALLSAWYRSHVAACYELLAATLLAAASAVGGASDALVAEAPGGVGAAIAFNGSNAPGTHARMLARAVAALQRAWDVLSPDRVSLPPQPQPQPQPPHDGGGDGDSDASPLRVAFREPLHAPLQVAGDGGVEYESDAGSSSDGEEESDDDEASNDSVGSSALSSGSAWEEEDGEDGGASGTLLSEEEDGEEAAVRGAGVPPPPSLKPRVGDAFLRTPIHRLAPHLWHVYYHAGVALLQLGDTANALLCASRSLALATDYNASLQPARDAAVATPHAPVPVAAAPWLLAALATSAVAGVSSAAGVLRAALEAHPNDLLLRLAEARAAELQLWDAHAATPAPGAPSAGGSAGGGDGSVPSLQARARAPLDEALVLHMYTRVSAAADMTARAFIEACAVGSAHLLMQSDGSAAQQPSIDVLPTRDIGIKGALPVQAPPAPHAVRVAINAHLATLRVALRCGELATAHAALAAADSLVDACGAPLRAKYTMSTSPAATVVAVAAGTPAAGASTPAPAGVGGSSSSGGGGGGGGGGGSTAEAVPLLAGPFSATTATARNAVPISPPLRADVIYAAGLLHEACGAYAAAEAQYLAALAHYDSHVPSLVRLADINVATAYASLTHGSSAEDVAALLARPVAASLTEYAAALPAPLHLAARKRLPDAGVNLTRAQEYCRTALQHAPRCHVAWGVLARVEAAAGSPIAAATSCLAAMREKRTTPMLTPSLLPLHVNLWT